MGSWSFWDAAPTTFKCFSLHFKVKTIGHLHETLIRNIVSGDNKKTSSDKNQVLRLHVYTKFGQ